MPCYDDKEEELLKANLGDRTFDPVRFDFVPVADRLYVDLCRPFCFQAPRFCTWGASTEHVLYSKETTYKLILLLLGMFSAV